MPGDPGEGEEQWQGEFGQGFDEAYGALSGYKSRSSSGLPTLCVRLLFRHSASRHIAPSPILLLGTSVYFLPFACVAFGHSA